MTLLAFAASRSVVGLRSMYGAGSGRSLLDLNDADLESLIGFLELIFSNLNIVDFCVNCY